MANADNTSLPNEEWRPVVGFEGKYEVSSLGRVRSLTRTVHRKDGRQRIQRGRMMKPIHDKKYDVVFLGDGGKGRRRRIHELVLEAFVGPRPKGMHSCHGDDNGRHNHLSNLRYGTPSENGLDRTKNGNDVNTKKTHCPRGHGYSGPNVFLVDGNKRGCLACIRTRSYQQRVGSLSKEEFKTVSDQYYEQIMAG